MISYSDQVEKTFRVMNKMEGLNSLMKEAETAVRGYIITRDSIYLEPLTIAKNEIPATFEEVKKLVADNDVQRTRMGLIQNAARMRIQVLESSVHMVNAEAYDSVKNDHMMQGRNLMESFKLGMNKMMEYEQKQLVDNYQQKDIYQRMAPTMFRWVFGLVGLAFLILFILLLREFFKRLKYQEELQLQLMALKQSHAELTQLAFAASHDLQEPVRKIRTFSDRLIYKQKEKLDEDGKKILQRIDVSARRLQGMLEDVSGYMNLIDSREEKKLVSVKKIIEEVRDNFRDSISQKNAMITIGNMPELWVYPAQVRSMFRAFIDNALKYSKTGQSPAIIIYSEQIEGRRLGNTFPHLDKTYTAITIKDNGIGFDNEFRDKIFQIFRRLHTQESFSGKGIGLAICQRVMANHNGVILADAKPGEGATFTLLFPRD
ncbi:CHASE3 domain-containing protein [Flavihumibacter sp. ZG627]|uniref:sensor histidine kinase n=1 Tax=Flavihumibacter sp. ZG627 TaxID=1463156 RepID=UPI00210F3D4C|nr:sensor histidine kinase [Flavihumibacter sp. ZG627]